MNNVKPSQSDRIDVKPSTLVKAKEVAKQALKGLKLGSPLPEFKQPWKEEKETQALQLLEKAQELEPEQAKKLIQDAYDLLDDGKINKSRVLPAKTAKRIQQVASVVPTAAYIIYAIITGDFDLSSLLTLTGLA